MEPDQLEEVVMQIITNSGEARSHCLNALKLARQGEEKQAEALMTLANTRLSDAHKVQTQLIQNEIQGEPIPIRLIVIHAQDHLMNAQTIRDLAIEIIAGLKLINARTTK